MRRLPRERILYFGDTARVPYGIKSEETIARYATQIAQFLLARQVKLLVIACNTMAAVAARTIANLSPVPVLNVIAAGAAGAVAATSNRRVGVIGTLATINSGAYERAIREIDSQTQVLSQACPLFVPLVEEGWFDHPVARLTAQEYLGPLLQQSVDTLVLGCTHYPLLKPLLQEVGGAGLRLVDSADAMALQAEALLRSDGLENTGESGSMGVGGHHFFVTDVPQRFRKIGEQFLGQALTPVEVVRL
jgi:glutamate racemase